MINLLYKFSQRISFLLLIQVAILFFATNAFADIPSSSPGYSDDFLKANHSQSLLYYENYIQRLGVLQIDDCFSTGKAMIDSSEFNTVCIPGFITQGASGCESANSGNAYGGQITRALIYAGLFNAGLAPLAILVLGIDYLYMTDICTNSYILQPHEYINRVDKQMTCIVDPENFVVYDTTTGKAPLTQNDVPYYYHCDPLYDPVTKTSIDLNTTDPARAKLIGRTWGYMGSGSQYCVGDNANYARPDMVGKVVVEILPAFPKIFGNYKYCLQDPARQNAILTPGDQPQYAYAHFLAYYKRDMDAGGKVKLCVGAPYTMFPVRVGCSQVAPPGEDTGIDADLLEYIKGTRCYYLVYERKDLNSLGVSIQTTKSTDDDGQDRTAVASFLRSDLHFTSTVVGCVKDMLQKVFIRSPDSIVAPKPYFQVVQDRLKQIIYAVLILYIIVVGIRVMISPQPPQRAEFVMWIIKYALVMYFALGNAFYSVDSNNNVTGLYPQLMSVSDEIANLFLSAQNKYEPIGYCTYMLNGRNILGEGMITGAEFPNLTPTEGFTKGTYAGVKLTVWDLVDCKLANYLNAGTCDYSVGGMVLIWVSTLFMFTSEGLLYGIVTFIYCFLLMLVIFKFAHIFILAAIIITILLFLSPIFVCFYLFEVTKGIFDKWLKVIFGYMLYPALLFAFLALMLATLDAIYYGSVITEQKYSWTDIAGNPSGGTLLGGTKSIQDMCKDADSLFCDINNVYNSDKNLCKKQFGFVSGNISEQMQIGGTDVKVNRLTPSAVSIFNKHMVKLMLFAFLFYLFMNRVSEFMAALLSVQPLSMAKGEVNIFSAMKAAVGGAASGASKVVGKMTSKR